MTFNAEPIVPMRWFKWASCQRVAMLWKGQPSLLEQTQLDDPVRRPPVPRGPLPDDLFERRGPLFMLDPDLFAKNLRISRGGAAGGPPASEHLRPLLEHHEDMTRFWRFAQDLAREGVPDDIVELVRLGRMTALQKPTGGVRGIVAGEIIRRLVARTISQQLSPVVESATAPFQYALSTKSGGECIVHALQALTDLDGRATVLSIDGIGAFDLISRGAMLNGLRSVPGGDSALPFVLQFYGHPSSYLWDDDEGVTHEIRQEEGGEQGDAMMPLLYALGQHQSVQSQLRPSEGLLAFHDDIYVVTSPERTCEVHTILREACGTTAGSRFRLGRHRYGTALELSLVILTSCCVLPGWWTHMPNSGLGIWQHRQRNVASVCWKHPLVLMRTSAHICKTSSIPTKFSSAVFMLCPICSLHGCCSCVCVFQIPLNRLLCSMTTMCGIVCVN